MPDQSEAGELNYYYVAMIIRYITKNFPDWDWDWKQLTPKWKAWAGRLFEAYRLPPDNWVFAMSDKDKVQLLQWYHYGSILKLCEQEFLPNTWLSWHDCELEDKVSRLAKAAKIVSAEKLSAGRNYVAEDEIFDRLSFVSDELELEPLSISTVTSLSMKRIRQRDNTRSLNPGWLAQSDEGSTSGPWEIHALCHHSRLVVLTKEETAAQDWRAKGHTREEVESRHSNN